MNKYIDAEKLNDVIGSLQQKQSEDLDKILREAFLEHFGFPIHEVQDIVKLEHIIVQGDPIESFRYRGETFLYLNRGMDMKTTQDGVEVTYTTKFKKI